MAIFSIIGYLKKYGKKVIPNAGLEPATLGLKGPRSTDWANPVQIVESIIWTGFCFYGSRFCVCQFLIVFIEELPHLRIERRTYSLQNWCSTTELKGHICIMNRYVLVIKNAFIGNRTRVNTWRCAMEGYYSTTELWTLKYSIWNFF